MDPPIPHRWRAIGQHPVSVSDENECNLQSLSFSRRVFATPFDRNSSSSFKRCDLISLPFSALTFISDVISKCKRLRKAVSSVQVVLTVSMTFGRCNVLNPFSPGRRKFGTRVDEQ
jgi:hypothetical protein